MQLWMIQHILVDSRYWENECVSLPELRSVQILSLGFNLYRGGIRVYEVAKEISVNVVEFKKHKKS